MRIITVIIEDKGGHVDLRSIETGNGSRETPQEKGVSSLISKAINDASSQSFKGVEIGASHNPGPDWLPPQTDGEDASFVEVSLEDGTSLRWAIKTKRASDLVINALTIELGLPDTTKL